jgi:hypothetical protein
MSKRPLTVCRVRNLEYGQFWAGYQNIITPYLDSGMTPKQALTRSKLWSASAGNVYKDRFSARKIAYWLTEYGVPSEVVIYQCTELRTEKSSGHHRRTRGLDGCEAGPGGSAQEQGPEEGGVGQPG